MTSSPSTRFNGRGPQSEREDAWENLPVVNQEEPRRPDKYIASEDLSAAVNVALTLGMPLLLTGEPGSGKSQLAYRLAWELRFPDPEAEHAAAEPTYKPLKFVVKSTTEARDLFYTFDTVGRFHAAQTTAKPGAEGQQAQAVPTIAAVNFIEYQALGLAILRAKGRSRLADAKYLAARHRDKLPDKPVRSVVLIDEIDKAPRDVPNDILAEIEEMSFSIPELDRAEVRLDKDEQRYRPVVIITSNAERELPPAFLRRCVYYHVPFPPFDAEKDSDITVRSIVQSRLGDRFDNAVLADAISLFRHVREKEGTGELYGKPPSIAELLSWLEHLHREHFAPTAHTPAASLRAIPAANLLRGVQQVLLKSRADQDNAAALIAKWREARQS